MNATPIPEPKRVFIERHTALGLTDNKGRAIGVRFGMTYSNNGWSAWAQETRDGEGIYAASVKYECADAADAANAAALLRDKKTARIQKRQKRAAQ